MRKINIKTEMRKKPRNHLRRKSQKLVCASVLPNLDLNHSGKSLIVSDLRYQQLYLDNLPSAEAYEKSYMHRDIVSHVAVTK